MVHLFILKVSLFHQLVIYSVTPRGNFIVESFVRAYALSGANHLDSFIDNISQLRSNNLIARDDVHQFVKNITQVDSKIFKQLDGSLGIRIFSSREVNEADDTKFSGLYGVINILMPFLREKLVDEVITFDWEDEVSRLLVRPLQVLMISDL